MDMMVNEINDLVAGSLRVEGLLMGQRAGGRARFDPDKKRELVELFHLSGASLADVASANSLKVDLLRQWVNQARLLSASVGKARRTKKASLQTTLLPVVIKPASGGQISTDEQVAAAGIEVLLPKGTIRLQSIDTGMLRTLVGLLA
jgi:transposase-like protein